jgi:hypothetical protein
MKSAGVLWLMAAVAAAVVAQNKWAGHTNKDIEKATESVETKYTTLVSKL